MPNDMISLHKGTRQQPLLIGFVGKGQQGRHTFIIFYQETVS